VAFHDHFRGYNKQSSSFKNTKNITVFLEKLEPSGLPRHFIPRNDDKADFSLEINGTSIML
jgi:hypothetical protein